MPRHRRLRSPRVIALSLVLAVLTLACVGGYGAAPHEDPPEEKIPRAYILGLWEDETGRTIDFHDDGTFTAVGDTYGPGLGTRISAGEFTGTWALCDDYQFEKYDEGGVIRNQCEDTGVGEWISISAFDFAEPMILTGLADDARMYPYNVDVSVEDDQFYAKVD